MDERLQLGSVVRDATRLAADARHSVAAAILVGTGLFTLIDVLLEPMDALRAMAAASLIVLYLQLLVTARALQARGQTSHGFDPRWPTMGRYPRAFAISIVSTIAVLAGLLLLLIPGLVLFLRWSLAYPAMLAEDEGVGGSLRRSWDLTRNRWPLLLGYGALILLLWGAALALQLLLYPEVGPVPLVPALVSNSALMAAQIFGWLLSASLYMRLREDEAERGRGRE